MGGVLSGDRERVICRMDGWTCDVTVVRTRGRLECRRCPMLGPRRRRISPDYIMSDGDRMATHLRAHETLGHLVPEHVYDSLRTCTT